MQGVRGAAGLAAPVGGLFSSDPLAPFKPIDLGYNPLGLETIKLFDFIDYNPLRNLK